MCSDHEIKCNKWIASRELRPLFIKIARRSLRSHGQINRHFGQNVSGSGVISIRIWLLNDETLGGIEQRMTFYFPCPLIRSHWHENPQTDPMLCIASINIMHVPVIVESHMLGSKGLSLFAALGAIKIKLALFISQRPKHFQSR